jgi:NitT/TauT family transport system substrate-binding protein
MSLRDNFITTWVKANGVGGIDSDRMAKAIEQISVTYEFKNAKPKPADLFDAQYLPPAGERKL